jgi:small subunit ribosomal protein S9
MTTTTTSAKRFFGVGKRKSSIARLYITPGDGDVKVNKRAFAEYFPREALRHIVLQPMDVTGNMEKFDIQVNVRGGGVSAQAQAVRHALAKALLALNQDYRKPLNKNGFLTRDPRRVERKKYGHRKARRSTQFSKR